MSAILQIETSTTVCSVALAINGTVVALQEANERNIHAGSLTVFIDAVMRKGGLTYSNLDAVAVAMGPGSYTGLRIGVSTAKGICFAVEKPLIAVSTLELMAQSFIMQNPDCIGLLCPMIDARRMEVYTALYDCDLSPIHAVSAEIIDENSFGKLLENHRISFFGDGAEKCMRYFASNNAVYQPGNFNTSTAITALAVKKFKAGSFEDVAYFEPFYLKDFVVTQQKKKF